MAEYWEDWSGYSVGDDPTVDGDAGWTRRWHADESMVIADISSDSPPSGYTKAFRITGANDRRFYSLDSVDSDGDRATVKVAHLIRFSGLTSGGFAVYGGPVARGSGTSSSETGISGSLATDAGTDETLDAIQYNNGSSSPDTKSTTSSEWFVDTWYWLEAGFDGTTVDVDLYPENDPGGTPVTSHQRTGVDVTAAGWVGIFTFGTNSREIDIAAVNIATGASTLSYQAPAGGSFQAAWAINSNTVIV